MLAQQFLIDTRFVIETLEIAFRDKFDEVLVSRFVFTQDDQMIRAAAGGIAIEPVRFRDIHLATNDRFDTSLGRGFIESDRAKKISVIGDGHSRHFVFRGGLGQCVVIASAIEKTEPRVQVEMNKR